MVNPEEGTSFSGRIVIEDTLEEGIPVINAESSQYNPKEYHYDARAPVNIGVDEQSHAINIQSQTDSEVNGAFGNIYWITNKGERYATVVGSSYDQDFAIYTKKDSFGSGDSELTNRFNLGAGDSQVVADWHDIRAFRVEGDSPAFVLRPTGSDTPVDVPIVFSDYTDTPQWEIDYQGTADKSLAIVSRRGGEVMRLRDDRISLQHKKLTRPRVYNNASPSELSDEELALDKNRSGTGAAAWLYKDSGGIVHYWDADGTLQE